MHERDTDRHSLQAHTTVLYTNSFGVALSETGIVYIYMYTIAVLNANYVLRCAVSRQRYGYNIMCTFMRDVVCMCAVPSRDVRVHYVCVYEVETRYKMHTANR